MNKEFTLKSNNRDIEAVKSKIIHYLNKMISIRQDCKVRIEPLDFRSMSALKAYWMLINRIVKWDSDNHGYKADVWDQWFKTEAGLTEEIDLMPLWKMKYFKKGEAEQYIVEKIKKYSFGDNAAHISYRNGWYWQSNNKDSGTPEYYFIADTENRYIEKTRSISNKGDVTKEEMSRLLMTVLKFGAENDVPDCAIKDTELENMLRAYDQK